MKTEFFKRPANDPAMNHSICTALQIPYAANPTGNIRILFPDIVETTDSVTFLALDTTIPPTLIIKGPGKVWLLAGGTSGPIHIPRLIESWENPQSGPHANLGLCPAFAAAGRAWIDRMPTGFFADVDEFFLCGHSYGGACAQALGVILRSASEATIRMWSYGAPRTGSFVCQTLLRAMHNTRFFADNDPVRFIPPHSNEMPTLFYLASNILTNGMNKMIQGPTGWQLEANGHIAQTEGISTDLHQVAFSVAAWCADYSGFRSVNHALPAYIERFSQAAALGPVVPQPGAPAKPEEAYVVTPSRSRLLESTAETALEADAVSPTGQNRQVQIPQIPFDSPLRYRRRKVGNIWGVVFAGEVVAIGPGKRRAGILARRFNRTAKAMQIVAQGV